MNAALRLHEVSPQPMYAINNSYRVRKCRIVVGQGYHGIFTEMPRREPKFVPFEAMEIFSYKTALNIAPQSYLAMCKSRRD